MLHVIQGKPGEGEGVDQKGSPERGMEYMMNLRYM